jgi:hypothetical protein
MNRPGILVRAAALVIAVAASSAVPEANAIPITFTFEYSTLASSATGIGSVTMESTLLPNPGDFTNVPAASLGISAFSITISEAGSGNGTFGLASVTNFIWRVSTPIDLGAELVGQAGFEDFNWCGFLFDDCTPPAPGGVLPMTIQTNAETGDTLFMVSMRSTAVPEPESWMLTAIGGLGLIWLGSRSWFLPRAVRRG